MSTSHDLRPGAKVTLMHRGYFCVGRVVTVGVTHVRIRVSAADGSRPMVSRPLDAFRGVR